MSVEVRIPSVLQKSFGGLKTVDGQGETVGQIIDHLDAHYPGFKERLTSEDGQIHRFINIFLNDEDIRFLNQLDTRVGDGDIISILPALAGGCCS